MKVYISGKITGEPNFKDIFSLAEYRLKNEGHEVLSPLAIANVKLSYDEYLKIDYAMIEVADAVYMLKNWKDSAGAKLELQFAKRLKKKVLYEQEEA